MTAPQPVPDSPATAAARVAEDGSAAVAPGHLRAVPEAAADESARQDRQPAWPPVAAAYGHIEGTPGSRRRAHPATRPAALAGAGETSPGSGTLAAIRGLGGNEWLWLLSWLYDNDPGLAARGVAALSADRRERAEAARIRRNRKATLRSRRRRQRALSGQ